VKRARAAVLLALAGALLAPPPAARAELSPDRERYCSLLRHCGLPEPNGWCAGTERKLTYDSERCADARRLNLQGIDTGSALGYRLFQFLGARYQVVFASQGVLDLSPPRLAFLVDDLPLAAKLLSHFQKTRYAAAYLDAEHRRFSCSRGDALTAEAERVLGSPALGRVEYFGSGQSQVGPWALKGLALLQATLWPAPGGRRVAYRVRVVSSPANAAVNAVMKGSLFRSLVERYVRDTLDDITQAAGRLQSKGLADPPPDWTPEDRKKLAEFLRLP
jgi:hypothetical protein